MVAMKIILSPKGLRGDQKRQGLYPMTHFIGHYPQKGSGGGRKKLHFKPDVNVLEEKWKYLLSKSNYLLS